MGTSIPISRICRNKYLLLIATGLALFNGACQNRAPSLHLLDARSDHDDDISEVGLYQRAKGGEWARKSAPKIARVYLYPHEMPTKDYFWGGYVSLVVSPDEWITEDPAEAAGPELQKETEK